MGVEVSQEEIMATAVGEVVTEGGEAEVVGRGDGAAGRERLSMMA